MKYFGTDGIRGKAYIDINEEIAYKVGRSLELLEEKLVVIGRDTRVSGNMIVNAIKKGALEAGLEVLDLEVVPTPLLAYFSILNDCHGVMVTASHNPYQDNGIKVFNRGRKTTINEEEKIEAVIDGQIKFEHNNVGKILDYFNPLPVYIDLYKDFLCTTKMNIILDLANGATVKSAKYIFSKINSLVTYVGDQPDGKNINFNVGSTHIDHLAKKVIEGSYDVGFSFDGDGDRVLAVDKTGKIIDGDLLIYVIACYLQEKDALNNNLVVLSKMSNLGIIHALEARGIRVIQTDVGDKYIVEALTNFDGVLGGENSGHIINRNLFISGDGVLNAAFIVKILEEKKATLNELLEDVSMFPDKLVNLRDIDKTIVSDPEMVSIVDYYRNKLGDQGKVLVRASGTEALIRISCSAKTEQEVDEIIQVLINKIHEINEKRGL